MADSLLERLESRHPTWEENRKTWQEIEDVLYDRVKNRLEEYIPRGHDEEPTDYNIRKRFARFKGELLSVIHRMVGAVTSRPPTRSDEQVALWGHFIDNCDGGQTHLDQFLEDRLFEAFGFGASAMLVDRLPVDDQGFYTEETSKGFEPYDEIMRVENDAIYLVPYRISQVVDWSVDRQGEFHWVRLYEDTVQQLSPDETAMKVDVYREFDRRSWRVYHVYHDGDERRADLIDEGDHHLGIVPLAIVSLQKEKAMSFHSPMRYAYQHDIANFIADADLQYDQWLHAHPTLVDYTADESKTRLTIGPGSRVKRNPTNDEDVKYLELNGATLKELRESKKEAIEGLRRISGIEMTEQDQSASGRSRAMQFSVSEERHLRRAARALARCECRIFEIAERWVDPRTDISSMEVLNSEKPVYPFFFTNAGTEGLIEQWIATRSDINSETYDKEMQKKIVDSALGDVPSDVRKMIVDEIEKNDLVGGASERVEMRESMSRQFETDDETFGQIIDEQDNLAEAEAEEDDGS